MFRVMDTLDFARIDPGEIMPNDTSELLFLPEGSTYAMGSARTSRCTASSMRTQTLPELRDQPGRVSPPLEDTPLG
jgi:hypothetical protein